MSLPYTVKIHADVSHHQMIRKNVFITCTVLFETCPRKSLRLAFCLDCHELLSYSGALKHSKQLESIHHISLASLFCPEKIEKYKHQILSDVGPYIDKSNTQYVPSQVMPMIHVQPQSFDDNGGCDPPHFRDIARLTSQRSLAKLNCLVLTTTI